MLETVRKRLRELLKLIEKVARKPLYTDFADQLGGETAIALPGISAGTDYERFRAKARHFLRAHEKHVAVQKLRTNVPLSAQDLTELESLLTTASLGTSEDLTRAKEESHGLGAFVRSLVGLDREAAKKAFTAFLTGKTATANQIEFINMIIDHLTQHGSMDAALLYESPYTDVNPLGVAGVFTDAQVQELMNILHSINDSAAA
jgi:type I restriction enzyme R subunit